MPDARVAGGYVQHEDFPLLPYDCPPDFGALLVDCLQLNHLQRPCFEEVLMRLQLVAAATVSKRRGPRKRMPRETGEKAEETSEAAVFPTESGSGLGEGRRGGYRRTR